MKRTLSFILAIMMVISLGTCFSVNVTAEEIYVPEDGTMQNIEIAKVTAAPTMDGKVDSSYSKIFDISGADTWYLKPDDSGALVWGRDNHATVDYNSESRRYDASENPERTSSEWYNSRIEGYASWDATNLYLCIVITTPHEINDNRGGRDSWMGDDLEIAVQNVSKNAATKFVMSQVAGALQVYPADVAGLGISKSKTYDTTGLVNKTKTLPGGGFYKTETGYVYELTLAWKTGFGITAKSGDSIPFNAAVNFNNAAADAATSCGIQAGAGIYNEGGKVNLLTKDSDNKSLGFAIKLVDSIPCAHTNTEWVAGKAFSATEGSGTEHKVCKDCGKKLTTRYVNEAAEAAILVSSASAKVGEEVEVTVALKNNPGIVSMALAVEFPSALTLVEVKDAGKLGATVHNPSLVSPYYLNWVNDTATTNFTVNGTIATLKFKVNENAADNAEYDIKVSYTPDNYEIYDKDGNEVDFAIENGKITVTPCNHTGGEATCISPAICEICGKPYGDVNPNNHKNTEYRNAQEPTCNEKGKEADLFCLDCQKVVKEGAEIPATGNHVCASGEWKYDENGHFHVCDNCQIEFGRENHKGGEATCKAAAVCEVCGSSYGTVDANNHKNVVLKNNVAPTCKDPGYSGDKVCEDCGTVVETGHEIAATGNHIDADGKWEFDGTNHFHTCGCGTKFDFAPHEGGEATCVAAKVCEVCGASYGDVDPDNHKNTEYRNAQEPTCNEKGKEADLFCLDCQKVVKEGAEIPATGNHVCASGEWKYDENGHFHVCDNCQIEFGRENHKGGEATCKAAAVCEVCGSSYGTVDANNHKNVVLKNNVAPTCKDPGYSGDKVCEDCGTVVETGHEIAATGEHVDADGKWEFDGTNHFHTCGCGTEFDIAPHEGGEATCVAAKICTVCGASYGDIDANNHKNTHVVGKQDATCCEKGYTGDIFCDDCQTTITYGTEIAATGNHVDTDGKWNFDENGHFHTCYFGTEFDRENHRGGEATCITRATCEVCGHSYGETDRTNHKSIAVVGAVAATETSTGYTGDKVCEDCHATVEAGTEIPMLEHNPAKVEAKAATSAEKGNIEYWYCENCGKYYSDAECQNEITKEETEIAKLAPTMIEGNGSKVDKAEKKGLTFKSDAAFADFIGVEIDGKAVDASAYTVKGDNIEIELTAEFINTLSVGEHSIAIASESGKAAAAFTVTDSSVKKPDGTNDTAMSVWMLILTVSGAAVVFAGKKKFAK